MAERSVGPCLAAQADSTENGVAKLKVLCARSMHVAVGALGRRFSDQTGHTVDFDFGTVGALQDKLNAGAIADVLILSAAMIEKLAKAGALESKTRRDVARTFIAVCIREGAPPPVIATPEAFKKTLTQARAIAFSDPAVGGSAGVYLADLFERIGIAPMIREKGSPQQTGAEVARRVVEGKAEIGLTLSGEVASVEGAVIAGPLPPPYGQDTIYCAAMMSSSREKDAAMAFIAALTRPQTRELWQRAGFATPDTSS